MWLVLAAPRLLLRRACAVAMAETVGTVLGSVLQRKASTHVEPFGGVLRGDLINDVPAVPADVRERVVRVHRHSVLGDVTVRTAEVQSKQ